MNTQQGALKMSWSPDSATHKECVATIQKIANEPDKEKRMEFALRYIAANCTTLPGATMTNGRLIDYFSVVAMAAIHPDAYKTKEE